MQCLSCRIWQCRWHRACSCAYVIFPRKGALKRDTLGWLCVWSLNVRWTLPCVNPHADTVRSQIKSILILWETPRKKYHELWIWKNPTWLCLSEKRDVFPPHFSPSLSFTHSYCYSLRSELARRVVPRSLPCVSQRHSSQIKKLKVTLFSAQTHTLQKAWVKGWGERLCSIIKWDEDLFRISLWKKHAVAFIHTASAKDKQSHSPWLTNAELRCFDVPPHKWELSSTGATYLTWETSSINMFWKKSNAF